jgi:hypothetical protein
MSSRSFTWWSIPLCINHDSLRSLVGSKLVERRRGKRGLAEAGFVEKIRGRVREVEATELCIRFQAICGKFRRFGLQFW